MPRAMLAGLILTILGVAIDTKPTIAEPNGYYEVVGVEGDDMLKMRSGPGTGFGIIVGLPNGTVVRLHGCDQTGGTRWCKVSLKQSRGLRGYVSWAYLKKI
jgi:uncharacterized protein YraI